MNNDNVQQNNATLPPMPSSDEQSLAWNKIDNFYQTRSRDFWGQNQLVRETVKDYEKCNHYFIHKGEGVECNKCHFGLTGLLEIQNGKLFNKGEPLGI